MWRAIGEAVLKAVGKVKKVINTAKKPARVANAILHPERAVKRKIGNTIITKIGEKIFGEDTFRAMRGYADTGDLTESDRLSEDAVDIVEKARKVRKGVQLVKNTKGTIKNDIKRDVVHGRTAALLSKLRARAFAGKTYEGRKEMYESYKVLERILNSATRELGDNEVFKRLVNWRANYLDELLRLTAAIYDDGGYNTSYPCEANDGLDPQLGRDRYAEAIDELSEIMGQSYRKVEFVTSSGVSPL